MSILKLDGLNSGQVVKRLAGFNGESLKQVAATIGISPSALSQKCSGRIGFSAEEVAKLADHFHVSSDSILGREPVEVTNNGVR